MRWLFQWAAVGLFTLVGAQPMYSQNTQNAQGNQGGTGGTAQSGATGQAGVQQNANANQNRNQATDNAPGTANSQSGARRGGGYRPGDSDPWFADRNFRDELELDDDQVERLRDIYVDSWEQFESDNGVDSDPNRNTLEARTHNRSRANRRFNSDRFAEQTRDVFRNDAQRNRFNQLNMQYQGYGAFQNPRLQRELNLNDTQRRQLRDLHNTWNTELESLRGTYANDPTGTEARFNQLRDRTRTNFEGILNDQQRTAYNEMIGNRAEFGARSYLGANPNANANNPSANRLGTGTGTGTGPGVGTGTGVGVGTGGTTSGVGTGTGAGVGIGGTSSDVGSGTGGAGSGTGSGSGSGSGSGGSGSGGSGGGGSGS